MNKHADARAYLGVSEDVMIRSAVVDAVTADDFGPLPEGIAESEAWERASDNDREEIARFAAFLRVAGGVGVKSIRA